VTRRNPQPRLLEYYDIRDFAFDTGKPMPLQEGEGAVCERCGRLHAKVYVVQTVEGTTKSVGSGCCARAFEGWEPSKDEIKKAKAMFRSKRDAARKARLEELAAPLVARLVAMRVPEWQHLKTVGSPPKLVYGVEDPPASVWLDPSDLDIPEDKQERWNAYATTWLAMMADRLPLAPTPRGFTERDVRYLAERTAIAARYKEDARGRSYFA